MMKRKAIPKMLAVLLSLATMMSITTMVAFAVDENANNTSTSSGAHITGLPGYGNNNDYGYRVTVITSDGTVVSAADLPGSGLYDNMGAYYGSTGTDPNSGSNVPNKGTLPSDMPAPLKYSDGSGFSANGGAVRDYLLSTSIDGENQNIVKIAQSNCRDVQGLTEGLADGTYKVTIEPVFNLPSYTDLPVGTTRPDGKYVVSGADTNGKTYNYWVNPDGSVYECVGSIRDYITNEVQQWGGGSAGSFMGPVVREALRGFFLADGDCSLSALSEDELLNMINSLILSGDFQNLGLGMYIYSSGGTPPPPGDDQPETPPSGEENIHITESRITRRKNLTGSKLGNGETLGAHNFKWEIEAFSSSIQTCTGCHCDGKSITDKTNVINVEQSIDNQEAQGVIKPWSYMTEGSSYATEKFVKTWTGRTVGEDEYQFNGAGYCIVVIRKDDTIDLIDYRQYGNEGTIDGISSIVVNTDSTASRGRYANGSGYTYDVNLHYEPNEGKWGYDKKTVYTNNDKTNTTPSATEEDPNPTHTHSDNTRTETKETKFNTATAVDMVVHVTWDVYGGIPNGGTMDTTAAGLTQHLNGSHMETWLEIPMAGGTTSFHPYIKMMYDTNLAEKLPVYVAAQYERKIAPNEYVGVIFDLSANTGNKVVNSVGSNNSLIGKLALSSNQWSTHVTANAKVGNSDCVLPGGATLDLAILAAQRQTFTVEGLAPLIGVSGQKQVNASGGASGLPTQYEGQVQDNYIDYAKQVVEALETLNVQQYVSQATSDASKLQNITQAVWDMTGARAVSPQANSEEKYYFRPDKDDDPNTKENANMGDLDVQIGNLSSYTDITQALKSETAVTYYTFFTNTQGEIRVKTGSSLAASSTISGETDGAVVLSKGQTAANITDTKIKKINDKTHIVTKLVAALETNAGGDGDATWVGDGAWYNEAFDGITIVESVTKLKLGFIKPFGRVSVIDPKLCPQSASKSDILNSYVFSQIKMREYCEKFGSSAPGKLASYKGKEVKTQHLDELFKSDIFYIPNATVQDLR